MNEEGKKKPFVKIPAVVDWEYDPTIGNYKRKNHLLELLKKTKTKIVLSVLCLLVMTLLFAGGDEISTKDLQLIDGVAYLPNQDTPYTGDVVDYFVRSKRVTLVGKMKDVVDDLLRSKRISQEGKMKDGLKSEWWTTYRGHAQKQSMSYYEDGKKQGFCYTYHKNGRVKSKEYYWDGKRSGSWTGFHEDGTRAWERQYKDDKMHGAFETWSLDGRKRSRYVYENDVLISEATFGREHYFPE